MSKLHSMTGMRGLCCSSKAVLHCRGNFHWWLNSIKTEMFVPFIHLFKIWQVLLWRSKLAFLTNVLLHTGQENRSSAACFSFWCRLREAFCLKDFLQWSQLNVEKNTEWAFSRCWDRFRSKVKDFPHCSQLFLPDFWGKCTSSIWRFMFSSLVNCLSQWMQEWCFLAGSWSGLYWGILCTSFMCLLKWSLEIDCWHLSHLTFEGGSGLLSSLLRCFRYSLNSVNLSWHL